MVIRFILRYLANNEQLVQRLSESYPMQSAARFLVRLFNRTKSIAEENELKEKLSPERLKGFAKTFSNNVKQEYEQAKRDFKDAKK